jgi:hypothetical protein
LYEDGSNKLQYILMDKQLTYWWFSQLKTDYSGIAWYGKNSVSEGVGLSWCAINNPDPQKKISKLVLLSPESDGIYTVFGVSLSEKLHYVPVKPVSYGGPDDWAAATAMAAMIEGLAGIKDKSTIYQDPIVSPRWISANTDSVHVTAKYAGSGGYVSYLFKYEKTKKQIVIQATGSGSAIDFHVLLPQHAKIVSVIINNKLIPFKTTIAEKSVYADFSVDLPAVSNVIVRYN